MSSVFWANSLLTEAVRSGKRFSIVWRTVSVLAGSVTSTRRKLTWRGLLNRACDSLKAITAPVSSQATPVS